MREKQVFKERHKAQKSPKQSPKHLDPKRAAKAKGETKRNQVRKARTGNRGLGRDGEGPIDPLPVLADLYTDPEGVVGRDCEGHLFEREREREEGSKLFLRICCLDGVSLFVRLHSRFSFEAFEFASLP